MTRDVGENIEKIEAGKITGRGYRGCCNDTNGLVSEKRIAAESISVLDLG